MKHTNKPEASKDVYQIITDRIIEELEKGVIPWKKPWTGTGCGSVSHETGRPYSLLNQFLLGEVGEYITWESCKKEGGSVKKGAKSKIVTFWKMLPVDKTDAAGSPVTDEDGKAVKKIIPFLRYYRVFNVKDCDGIKAKYFKEDGIDLPAVANPDSVCEEIIADYVNASGIRFENVKQDRAYYSPSLDLVSLPLMDQFTDTSEYYSTAFHELTHSTGHKSRLDRFSSNVAAAAFGGTEYSKEELVAEIGAASLCHIAGLETPATFKNSAAYIQSWLKVLRNDKKMIVTASSKAEKAVALILGQNDETEAVGA